MARINIEENWFMDPRRSALIIQLGNNSDLADGAAINLWRLGQFHWKHGKHLIPIGQWAHITYAAEFERAGLVEVRENGVYVRGSEEHFEWIFERIEAAKKGGEAGRNRARDAKGHFLSGAKTAPSKHQANGSKTEASSSSSSSSSSSEERRITVSNETVSVGDVNAALTKPTRSRARKVPGTDVNTVVSAFCERWSLSRPGKKTYPVTGKDVGLITTLIQDLGLNKTLTLIEAYFAWPDPFVTKRGHSVRLLHANVAEVTQFMNSGKVFTKSVQRDLDERVDETHGQNKLDFEALWAEVDKKQISGQS